MSGWSNVYMIVGSSGGALIQRARRQTAYQPVWQDWLWYHGVISGDQGG